MILTDTERQRLDVLARRMKELDRAIRANYPTNPLAEVAAADLAQLESAVQGTQYTDLVDDEIKSGFAWLFSASVDEKRQYDRLVDEYNAILSAGKLRARKERDAKKAAVERAQIRAARCDSCFLIHRPSQKECD